jgi:ammonia channel protein AmtB
MVSKGDAFWTYSGGLAGIITASAGNDLYHPLQAFFIAGAGVFVAYKLHFWVERKFKVDDVVGAVAVHGYAGVAGLIICGFMLWGHPSSPFEGYASINPLGQTVGAIIMFFVLGFAPAWVVSKALKSAGMLRVPKEIEIAGLDFHEEAARRQAEEEVAEAEAVAARS